MSGCKCPENRCSENSTFLKDISDFLSILATFFCPVYVKFSGRNKSTMLLIFFFKFGMNEHKEFFTFLVVINTIIFRHTLKAYDTALVMCACYIVQ
jgi:hypothetical protein